MSDKLSHTDGVLHSLGEVVVAWGHYEDLLFFTFDAVLGGLEYHAQAALRNHLDIKKATEIMKSAALIRSDMPAKEHILQLVAWTDRPLREDRNRFIHDPLYSDGPDQLIRLRYITTVKKPKAFYKEKVTTITSKAITRELLQKFRSLIEHTETYAAKIRNHIRDYEDEPCPLSEVDAARDAVAALIAEYTALTKSLDTKK